MHILVGKRSRLSQALRRQLTDVRQIEVADALDLPKLPTTTKLIVCSAITDPKVTPAAINSLNVDLPVTLARKHEDAQVITFGTILEGQENIDNSYIASKRKLVKTLKADCDNWQHFRLNTLYGVALPVQHMFLNQLFYALSNNSELVFNSDGNQLREYHHYFDVANIVVSELEKHRTGIIELSHGNGLSLRSIATDVAKALGKSVKLKFPVSSPPEVTSKNRAVFHQSLFRDAISGITSYYKELYDQ